MTRLILAVKVPSIEPGREAVELPGRLWEVLPRFEAFAMSFLIIGVHGFSGAPSARKDAPDSTTPSSGPSREEGDRDMSGQPRLEHTADRSAN